jgi:hypothetical protein
MTPLEAIDPMLVAPRGRPRWTAGGDLLLRMLYALVLSEHPYAYLSATEQHLRPRA